MIATAYEKMVADYLRIPVPDVQELDLIYYLQARRDAFIQRCRESEEGREYLKNAWRLTQTKPDRKASRELFGRK